MKKCRLCTRNFFGSEEGRVKGDVCDYCRAKMAQLRRSLPITVSQEELEELVAQEQTARLERLSPWNVRKRIQESWDRDKNE